MLIEFDANSLSLVRTTPRLEVNAGTIGVPLVSCNFSSEWDGLLITLVFTNTVSTVSMIFTENPITIPWEVMATPSLPLRLGVYGMDSSEEMIMPTRWATICTTISEAPSTNGEPAVDPTPSVYAQWIAAISAFAEKAEASAKITANPGYIGDNGNWYVYSTDEGDYVDSGVEAQGEQGLQGDTGEQGIQGLQGDTGEQGETGAAGADGIDGTDALVYNIIKTASISPSATASTTFTAAFESFNRTPVVDDVCTVVWQNTSTGASHLCIARCTKLYTETCSMHIESFVETTGDTGASGQDGDDGVSIVSVTKTATDGLVDTYTITYSDNTTTTFDVTNGADGVDGQNGVDGVAGQDGTSVTVVQLTQSAYDELSKAEQNNGTWYQIIEVSADE